MELLIVDVDGMLYDYDRDRRVQQLATALDVSPQAVEDAVFTSGVEDSADAGEISTERYLAAVSERLARTLDRETWVRARIASTRPMPGELALCAEAARRTTVATLTNNSFLFKEEMPRFMPELLALDDVSVHVAAEYGVIKPDPAVFLAMTDEYGVSPDHAAFVDDAERHVDGARRAGLAAHHYQDLGRWRAWLVDLGIVD